MKILKKNFIGHEFACKNRQQCVLKSFLCDKENDCSDFSDEMGCGKKLITC